MTSPAPQKQVCCAESLAVRGAGAALQCCRSQLPRNAELSFPPCLCACALACCAAGAAAWDNTKRVYGNAQRLHGNASQPYTVPCVDGQQAWDHVSTALPAPAQRLCRPQRCAAAAQL